MRELAALCFCLPAFARFAFAGPKRQPVSLQPLRFSAGGWRALGAAGFAVALLAAGLDDVSGAALVVLTSASVVATGYVLLAPLWPRLMWALSAACVPVGCGLWWVGHAG